MFKEAEKLVSKVTLITSFFLLRATERLQKLTLGKEADKSLQLLR